ncbi:MAG TPA: PilZ domain-containing protein [Kofleriaceae bacterium]|nr:PilZ domain-containing protein [Kofleriaceae bacterium]
MLVEVIYRYRTLIGKCELGVGLELDEIDQVTTIEAQFAPTADDLRMRNGRKFRRESVRLTAVLRGDRIHDRVEVIELGPGGLVIRNAPYVARGEHVEVVVEDGDRCYRFRARGVWLRDDNDDYRVGLALVGTPVRLNKVAVSAHQVDVVDKIAAAA